MDVFLFPSLYPNEAQSFVNLEALAAGVAVCAFGLACLRSDLSGPACLAIDPADEFSSAVPGFLGGISLSALPAQARQLFDELLASADQDFEAFAALIAS